MNVTFLLFEILKIVAIPVKVVDVSFILGICSPFKQNQSVWMFYYKITKNLLISFYNAHPVYRFCYQFIMTKTNSKIKS